MNLVIAASTIENNLLAARQQMAFSLGSHIILSCFGVAFPLVIYIAHRRGLNGDESALVLAKRWSKVAGVLFAIGAVSGTLISFEMGMLWPGMMSKFGDVIGLPFALEGIAFFVEAIFLAIYLYGWNRIEGRVHIRFLIPIAISGAVGTFCIMAVNAWMNNPTGFAIRNGVVVDINPWAAMFNSAVWIMSLHMLIAAYMLVGLFVASVYAVGMLRGRRDHLHRIGLAIPLVVALVVIPFQPIVGHFAAERLAEHQPAKLAAIELQQRTEKRADLNIGGVYIDGKVVGQLHLPIEGLLSFLSTGNRNAEIKGFDATPESDRPPANVVHIAFDVMVFFGTLLVGLTIWGAISYKSKRRLPESRKFLWAVALSGPIAIVCLEAGWIVTEVGRQPWIVQSIQRVNEAVTPNGGIWLSYSILVLVYLVMTIAAVITLRSMSRRWRNQPTTDLPTPYGPRSSNQPESLST